LEVLLLPPDSESYYQIGVNSAGHHAVLRRNTSHPGKLVSDRTFQVETKGEVITEGWVAKVKIPLAQFASADFKKPWRFNVYRSRIAGGQRESYGIMLLSKNFHQNFELFPHLIFPEAAAK
jgi:hypothetical protein